MLDKKLKQHLLQINMMAKTYGWKFLDLQEETTMISWGFDWENVNTRQRLNLYWTTMTVGTAINHPTKGKTQLYRRHISLKELEKLFRNAREHTGKGYYVWKKGDIKGKKWQSLKSEFENQ